MFEGGRRLGVGRCEERHGLIVYQLQRPPLLLRKMQALFFAFLLLFLLLQKLSLLALLRALSICAGGCCGFRGDIFPARQMREVAGKNDGKVRLHKMKRHVGVRSHQVRAV
jgi:hypothetical protein